MIKVIESDKGGRVSMTINSFRVVLVPFELSYRMLLQRRSLCANTVGALSLSSTALSAVYSVRRTFRSKWVVKKDC